MALLVSDIVARCASALDAEGSEYYLFQQDYLPAILSAQDWIVGIINTQLGNKKFSEEIFSELTMARVFQASAFSRIRLSAADLGHDVWTLLSVEPLPNTNPVFVAQVLPNAQDSKYRNDLAHLNSLFFAQRTTAEEWVRNIKNPFHDSHIPETGETPSNYGYLNYNDYTSVAYTLTSPTWEIEVRPTIGGKPCTIRYVRVPTKPTLTTNFIEFPVFVLDTFVQATLSFMAVKQGDQTTLESLSRQFTAMLIGAIQ